MDNFRVGLKIFSSGHQSFPKLIELLDLKKIDYLELYIVPDSFEKSELGSLKDRAIIFHAPNFNHGFNIRVKNGVYDRSILTIKKFMEYFNEKRIIFHPGIETGHDDINIAGKNLRELKGKGFDIILENVPRMPIKGDSMLIASKFEDFSSLVRDTGVKVCVDIGHTILSANSNKEPPLVYLRKFLGLNPYMVHLCDGDYSGVIDNHIGFGEGNFPMKKIVKLIHENVRITLETPKKDYLNLSEDIKNLEHLNELFSGKE